MAAIEFTSRPGKTFVVAVRNPLNGYSALASGISCTEIRPGRYRATIGSLTGLVWIEAVDGNVRAVGFADLSAPAANGYADVVDAMRSPESIASKIDAISSEIASDVVSDLAGIVPTVVRSFDPVTKAIGLVRGDSYLHSIGTAIEIPINLPSGVVGGSISSARIVANHKSVQSQIIGSASIVLVSSQWTARVEFSKSATLEKQVGEYEYDVEITYNNEDITVLRGSLRLFRDNVPSA